MAWQYANWDTDYSSTADKLTYLREHIKEVSLKIRPDMNSGPGSVSTGQLLAYRDRLEEREKELRAALATASATFVRGIPR